MLVLKVHSDEYTSESFVNVFTLTWNLGGFKPTENDLDGLSILF
jgi:hypothetical protein